MRALFFFLIPVVVLAEDALSEASDLLAEATPATIELDPLPDNLRYLRLPDLEFDLRIEPRCDPEASVRSVLISVADTRLQLDGDDFDDSAVLQPTLILPRVQAGILRVDGFCRESDSVLESRLRIDAVFTARLSLRCTSESRESVAYANVPLDIVLQCRPGPTPLPDQVSPELSQP